MTDFTIFISQKKVYENHKTGHFAFVLSGDKLMWFFKS